MSYSYLTNERQMHMIAAKIKVSESHSFDLNDIAFWIESYINLFGYNWGNQLVATCVYFLLT